MNIVNLTIKENYYAFFLSWLWMAVLSSSNGGNGVYVLVLLVIILSLSSIIKTTYTGLNKTALILFCLGGIYFLKLLQEFAVEPEEFNLQDLIDFSTFYFIFILSALFYTLFTKYYRWNLIMKSIEFLIIILVIDGFIEFFAGFSVLRNDYRGNIRIHSIFEQNHYGSYMFFLYVLYSILSFKLTGFSIKRNTAFIFALVLLAEFMSLSRLPILLTTTLFFFQLSFFLVKKQSQNKISLLFITLFIVSLGVLFLLDQTRNGKYGDQLNNYLSLEKIQNEQEDRRFGVWRDSFEIIGENPLLGIRAGSFKKNQNQLANGHEILPHPHSIFIEFLLYSGIPLFTLSLFIFTVLIYSASGLYGLMLLNFTMPIIGPGSVANASWVLMLCVCLALLMTKEIHGRKK
jgi:hypothetical protein